MKVGDRHFAPYCEVPSAPPVGPGPQTVNLTEIAQVFRAMYRGPWDKDVPLPPHYWQLQSLNDPFLFLESTRSDRFGFSSVPMTIKSQRKASASVPGEVKFVNLRKANPADQWYLTLRPDIPSAARAMVVQTGEVWIDLEKNAWVTKNEFPQHSTQRLLRLPLWTSRWKALSGGFVDGPPGAFLLSGVLSTADLIKPFGTVKRPWRILVDAGWWRTYLRFQYYDFKWKIHATVPRGLTVKAFGKKLDSRTLTHVGNIVGGGTNVDDAGTIFVLHERTEEASFDVHFAFEDTSGNVRYVDSESMVLERRPSQQVPKDVEKRYVLPRAWHSFGWEGRVGDGKRRLWADLRPTAVVDAASTGLKTTEAQPLIFHLDDFVLYGRTGGPGAPAQTGPVAVSPGARITLFDRRLSYRGSPDPDVPQWWSLPISRGYVPADDGYAADNETRRQASFVIHHEGEFHTLRDDRVDGQFGTVQAIGARKAIARGSDVVHQRSPVDGDMVETALILDADGGAHETAFEGPFLASAQDARLCHLVVYQPLRFQKDPGEPFAEPPYPGATDAELRTLYDLLLKCEQRYDQHHPAHGPFFSAKKDYVAIPEGGLKKATRVVKMRHFFCPRATGGHLVSIRVTHEPGRSYVTWLPSTPQEKWMLLRIDKPDPGIADEDSDKAKQAWFTLAHELGHAMSLPDEYAEIIDVSGIPAPKASNERPRVPRFAQRDVAYPFLHDVRGLMRSNMLPRLRYYSHRMSFLNSAAAAALPEGPYVLAYPSFRGGTSYRLPAGTHPWQPFQSAQLAGGKSFLVLYRAGEDEATVEALWPRPAVAGNPWIDGILVIRTRIWFAFQPSQAGDFPTDKARWDVAHAFYKLFYGENDAPTQFFYIAGPPNAPVQRVGVLFEPRIELGPAPTPGATHTMADVIVEVVFQGSAVPSPPVGAGVAAPAKLVIQNGANKAGLSILRYALTGAFNAAKPDDSDLDVTDLEPIARAMDSMLGMPPLTFVVGEG